MTGDEEQKLGWQCRIDDGEENRNFCGRKMIELQFCQAANDASISC